LELLRAEEDQYAAAVAYVSNFHRLNDGLELWSVLKRPVIEDRLWPGLPVRDAGRQLPLTKLAITPNDCYQASR
jgi:hypothetical protein